ncbi:MAG TPA: hypothetical protein DCR17_10945 [Verrucomicrobiales bacterium]|nr:hypothetical protein [Pedosphaera sp.]MBL6843792.1 hypothetical protein [Verrucomicrobiae bacterium]RZO73740.1 MAG: hypothetical protein EVA71_01575 [Limisphaerales bacterium]HAO67187.1 hypothetical protein [Verrucomicrobiales bacterium]HBP55790.1 hypothetical protein [Verrucomicrobiales bacterium]|tara:strand:- start:268 stop:762 length:495 start_codon:yes stop_codon:yes gene_type:complete
MGQPDMQSPWAQSNQTFPSWTHRELRSLVWQTANSSSSSSRRLNAVSFVHQLFFSSVVAYPELWSIRRNYYSEASLAMIEICKELEERKPSIFICFACLPEDNLEIINAVETYCQRNPWSSDLVRLSLLMGMGEVEIAEILDIPERSVRRQIAACRSLVLPLPL